MIKSAVMVYLFFAATVFCGDWPQLQFDAAHTGRTTDKVAPDIRLRWLWLGPAATIRNKASNSAWTGPTLSAKDVIGNKTTIPVSVPFTFANLAQPVIAGGRVFVGDVDGKVYGINADDGTTIWTKDNAGGTIAPLAAAGGTVIAGSLTGKIRLYRATDGSTVGEISTDGPITSAPVTNGTVACVGSTDGHVYCVDMSSGADLWVSPDLGGQIVGGLCMDANAVYVGAENMMFYQLKLSDGTIMHQIKVPGQSFSLEWPVVCNNLVFVQTAPVVAIGSEYVMEVGYGQTGGPMDDAADMNAEQDNVASWLNGDTKSGAAGWSDASTEWRHLTVLNTSNFTEPYKVSSAPFDGCGTPPEPVVVDNQNRVLTYWKTRFPTLCKKSAFGTNHTIDISEINTATGRRVQINNGIIPTHDDWYTWETDNLYGLTCGSNYLYLRQAFRGTVAIDLTTSNSQLLSVDWGSQDGGNFFNADIIFAGTSGTDAPPPTCSQKTPGGRVGPAIAGTCLYFTEDFGLVCAEHQP